MLSYVHVEEDEESLGEKKDYAMQLTINSNVCEKSLKMQEKL